MNHNHTKFFIAGLVVSATINVSAANATDHRLWREQVARPADSVIHLESVPADSKQKHINDALPWREQIESTPQRRVFILEPAPKSARSSDTRLWREQIQSASSTSQLTAASTEPSSNETHNRQVENTVQLNADH